MSNAANINHEIPENGIPMAKILTHLCIYAHIHRHRITVLFFHTALFRKYSTAYGKYSTVDDMCNQF